MNIPKPRDPRDPETRDGSHPKPFVRSVGLLEQPTKQRKPTPIQRLMVGLMGFAYLTLSVWLIPEIRGVLSPGFEDTYSEWVWDLPAWAVLTIACFHLIAGVLFVWSAGHFIEGYLTRR